MIEVAIGLSLLALGGTLVSLFRSAPARLLRDARGALEAADHIEGEWHAERVRLATFKAEMEALAEAVERKRKQVASAEGRLKAGNANGGGEPDLSQMTTEEVRAHYTKVAQSRGWM